MGPGPRCPHLRPQLVIKADVDWIGKMRKVDVMQVHDSNAIRKRPWANYLWRHRPDLARDVGEVMEDGFDSLDWRTNETSFDPNPS